MNVKHFLLSSLQSGSAFLLVFDSQGHAFKRSDGDFLLSCVKLLAFIITWVILENGIGSKNNSLNESSEIWILWIVLNFKFIVSLFF